MTATPKDALAANLRSEMESRNLREIDIAAAGGISVATVYNVLNTKGCHLDTLGQIALALGMPAHELIRPRTDLPASERKRSSDSTSKPRKGKRSSRSQRGSAA